jgi:hypothetical protein
MRVRRVGRRLASIAFGVVLFASTGCGGSSGSSGTPPVPTPPTSPTPVPPTPVPPVTISAAGDVGWCGLKGAELTGRLLDTLPGPILLPGDVAYMDGSEKDFANCFDPHWGRHKSRIFPVPGNHDYVTAGGAPYYAYFGSNAGPPGQGYYSMAIGAWHVVGLNAVIPIGEGSPQLAWLRSDLTEHPSKCTLVFWHYPRFSSAKNGDNGFVGPALRVIYEAGADVLLAGHDHVYERMMPVNPEGHPDAARGIRQFTVGTGGAELYGFTNVKSISEVRASVWGVLRLTLAADGYDWDFISVPGESFRDFGTAQCH